MAAATKKRKTPSYEQELVEEFGSRRAIEGHLRTVLNGEIVSDTQPTAKLDQEVEEITERLGEIAAELGSLSPEKARQVKDAKRLLSAGLVR